jgi:hypothetical protein
VTTPRSIAILLAVILRAASASACDLETIDWESTTALARFLESCEREPEPDEQVLFTWGHRHKLQELRNLGYSRFSFFNDAQQYAYAGINAREFLGVYATHPGFQKYVQRLRTTLGAASVGRLQAYEHAVTALRRAGSRKGVIEPYLSDLDGLEMMLGLWSRYADHPGPQLPRPAHRFEVPLRGVMALAFEQVMPGFLDTLGSSVAELIAQTETDIQSTATGSIENLRSKGRRLGLTRARDKGAGDPPSKISYGVAVYLGASPHEFIMHFSSDAHAGIACRLNEPDRITDITSPGAEQALMMNNVLLSALASPGTGDERVPLRGESYPGGYNVASDPPRFRLAAAGRLIRRGAVYADSGVIRYELPDICRPIRLDDFDSCAGVRTLLSREEFVDEGSLFELLTRDERQPQLDGLLARIAHCAVTEPTPMRGVCGALSDEGFRNSALFRDHAEFVTGTVRTACRRDL